LCFKFATHEVTTQTANQFLTVTSSGCAALNNTIGAQ